MTDDLTARMWAALDSVADMDTTMDQQATACAAVARVMLDNVIAERDHLTAACTKWAEVSQSNYQRAKKAEADCADLQEKVKAEQHRSHKAEVKRDALRAEALDWRAQVDELSDELRTVSAEVERLRGLLQDIASQGRCDFAVVRAALAQGEGE